jgi:resuscitation-promoting factor RpfB
VGFRAVDDALRERCRESGARSRERRERGRRLRRRRIRVRGGALSLAAVVLCTAAAGTGIAVAGSSGGLSAAGEGQVVLKRGDRGPAVKKVQRRLHVKADGVFGRATVRAVKRFQRRKGLTIDGVVGPETRKALRLRAFSRTSVYRRSSGSVRLPRALRRIAQCESGGNPRAVSSDGRYRGKYQFSRSTWRNLGGRGDPAKASERTQDRLALKLYRKRGTAPWANCAG